MTRAVPNEAREENDMTTRPAPHVRVERSEDRRLARVILARPEVRNAFDDVLVKELQKIVRDLPGRRGRSGSWSSPARERRSARAPT